MAKEISLTDEQRKFIDSNWNKLKFVDLVKQTYKDEKLDGRSTEGKVVREYLGEREPIPTAYQRLPSVSLTDEQKEFIINNAQHIKSSNGKVSHTEIARQVFNNKTLTPLSLQARTVLDFLKTLPEDVSGLSTADDVTEEYKAPSTVKQVIERINEYLLTKYDHTAINANQRKSFETLISFMNAPRYLQMINSYTSKVSRKIFEGEFVRTVFDKTDSTTDDLNLCINLCWNYVQMITLNRHKTMLDEKYEASMSDPESKVSTALADMIAAKTKELNDCDQRQQKLIKDLQGNRAERNKNKIQNTLTVASLIEWWKDETERKARIRREELRREEVGKELDRMENMPEFKCRIIGFTRSELLN
jgi:hypothetical protein